MSNMPLPQKFALPPIGVTVTEEGQIRVEWLPHGQGGASPTLPPEILDAIADGVLRGEDDAALLARTGPVAGAIAQALVAEYRAHPLARLARQQQKAISEKLSKLESHARIDAQLARNHPARCAVERRETLDAETFFRDYYAANRPVVMTGMMKDWAALTRWTPQYFRERFGHVSVQIQSGRNSDPDYEMNIEKHRRVLPFADYVELVEAGGSGNDHYLVANNQVFDKTGLGELMQELQLFPELMDPSRSSNSVFFWYGPQGTVTPLHHDPCNLILAQVRGRKRIKMYPPIQTPLLYNEVGVFSRADPENPDASQPDFTAATAIETVLGPGEAIFIPVGWWHHVRSLDVAVSVSATCFRTDNAYQWQMPNHDTRPARQQAAAVATRAY